MAQSVSNDALWGKLLEVDKKLEQLVITKKTLIPPKDQPEIKIDFGETKDDIINEIREQSSKLGTHADSNFAVVNQNCKVLDENIKKVLSTVGHIRKHQKEAIEPKEENKEDYFNVRFFKIRKSSLLIAILGLLVFILTVFCMKQQNDYSMLMSEYYRQTIVIKQVQAEVDNLSAPIQKSESVKKRR